VDHGDDDLPWWTRSVHDYLGPRSDISLMPSSGLRETTTVVASLDSVQSEFLLKYLAPDIVTSFAVWMDCQSKVRRALCSSGRT